MEFSKHATDAMNAAASCARQFGHDHIGSEHIFLSILAIPSCSAVKRLSLLGTTAEELSESMRNSMTGGATTLSRGPLPITARTKRVGQTPTISITMVSSVALSVAPTRVASAFLS